MTRFFALALLLPAPAHAAAYYFLDAGTRALGRGGAFIAGNDDLSAQYYNPAALVHLPGPTAQIGVSMVSQAVLFDRADEPENGLEFEAVTNSSPPMAIPAFGYGMPIGDKLAFAVGFYSPYAPDMAYPEDGPQRYTLVDTLVWQAYVGPSVAWRPVDWLTVGGGVAWTFMRAEQELVVAMCLKGAACGDNPTQDVAIRLAAFDPAKLFWNAGVLVEPTPWLSVGASFVPPIKFEANGSIEADFGEDFSLGAFLDGTSFSDDDIRLLVNMPMIARLGVAARPMEGLEIEAAAVWERWSTTPVDCGEYGTGICITDVDLTITTNKDNPLAPQEDLVLTDDIVLATDYDDVVSFRLGADYDFLERYSARLGAFYEGSAIPAKTQGVSLVDGSKLGYGVGGAVKILKPLSLDLGFSQSFIAQREITDSEVKIVQLEVDIADPEASGIVQGKVVGNGTFSSHLTMASAAFTWTFGAGKADQGG